MPLQIGTVQRSALSPLGRAYFNEHFTLKEKTQFLRFFTVSCQIFSRGRLRHKNIPAPIKSADRDFCEASVILAGMCMHGGGRRYALAGLLPYSTYA